MRIYVGGLPFEASEQDLRSAFEAFGEVASVDIVRDKLTQQSRGFGFVEMRAKSEALSAIDGLNDTKLRGRMISVNEARARSDIGPRREKRRADRRY
jgi:RNA recognition motif-containing protein